jgi:hypothetical protein
LGRLAVAVALLAVGGLVLGGGSNVAFAQAADASWGVGVGAVLPANAVTAGNQSVSLNSVSCGSAGNCSAVGSYTAPDSIKGLLSTQGLLLTETAGVWATGAEAVLPANAATTGQTVDLTSVSCASPGNCGAVGTYLDKNGNTEGLLFTETAGTWAKGVEAVLPANALSASQTVQLLSVSCGSTGNCTAVGTYLVGGTPSNHGVILTEAAGTWSAGLEPALPANASAGQDAIVQAVSCVSASDCTAVGTYGDSSGNEQGLLLSKTTGTWTTGVELTVPADAYLYPQPSFDSVSCASAGDCSAVGTYVASAGGQGLLVTETGGSWAAGVAAVLPSNASSAPGPLYSLGPVSCAAAGECSAVGMYYLDNPRRTQGFLLGESGGVWATGSEAALPANAAAGYPAGLGSVSCPSAGNCTAVGGYYDNSNHGQALLLSETAGTWATGVEASLPLDANTTNPSAGLSAVSCASAGNCTAVGTYMNNSGIDGLLISSPAPVETLNVSKSGTGSGIVSSVPAGIDCGTICSHGFVQGTAVALTATPAAGSTFTGWAGACTGTATCNVAMDAGTSVSATFALVPPPPPKKCVVPKVTGKTLLAAKRSINSHDCSVGTIKPATSRTTKKGRVISQKPKAGTRLPHGARVNMKVSKGP